MALRRLTDRYQILRYLISVLVALAWPAPAEAAIVRGIEEVISGVFQLPLQTSAGTFNGPPLIGTIVGMANGLITGTGLVAHGALELAASGISIAKTVAPYLLPFLL